MQYSPLSNGQLPPIYVRGTFAPMTNAERQAEFRRRHPDYNRLYKARIRANTKACLAAQQAAALAATPAPAPAVAEPVAAPAKKVQLLLPAPVVLPVLPGINTIPSRAEVRERVAVAQDHRM